MKNTKLLLLVAFAMLVAGFFAFDLGQYLSLGYLKSRQADFAAFYQANPLRTAMLYFLVYIAVTGLSLPGATILTLVGGAVFGLVWGTVLISFASTIGATIAFLVARFLLRDLIQARFGGNLRAINAGRCQRRCVLSVYLAPGTGFSVLHH